MPTFAGTRDQRRRKLGVDSVGRVVWRNWEPGKEYVRKIRVRNLDARAQTITYKQPLRKSTFFMDYPDPVTLSSGMSFDIEVRFRPTELVELHDTVVVVVVDRGSYAVHLECELPFAKLQLPTQHDFGYVGVGTTAAETLQMKNAGTMAVDFVWDLPSPFAITPARGVLQEDETVDLKVTFSPSEACTLLARAVCTSSNGTEELGNLKLSGIGKYPFVRAIEGTPSDGGNTVLLDFGPQLSSTTRIMTFTLENPSMVDAAFSLEVADTAMTCPFTVKPTTGVIARGTQQTFKVLFAPRVSGMVHVNELRVVIAAGNTVFVQLRGVGAAPNVRLSTRMIDFGDVKLDEESSFGVVKTVMVGGEREGGEMGGRSTGLVSSKVRQRFFAIKNNSEIAVKFCFIAIAPGAAFVVEPVSGELPAKGSVRVKVEFCPTHSINYLRRLLIYVEHAEGLLYVDVFGSAYDSIIRPMPFGIKEVESFFKRQECGLGSVEPDDLVAINNALQSGRTYDEVSNLILSMHPELDYDMDSNNTRSTITMGRKKQLDLSYITPGISKNTPFYLNTGILLFFANNNYDSQQVIVYNKTKTPATAYWCYPHNSAFRISPTEGDVPPCSFCKFTLSPTSAMLGPVAEEYLECYVNYKQMRSFRLVEEGGFTPPCFFPLHCQWGVSTGVVEEGTLLSNIKVPGSLIFPACRTGELAHTILDLENRGNVAVMFTVTIHTDSIEPKDNNVKDATNGHLLTCSPTSGLLLPHQDYHIVLSFQPTFAMRFRGKAIVTFNHSERDEVRVALQAESFSPELVIEDRSMIVLQPTCVTGESHRRLKVSNPTCIPIMFNVFPSLELMDVVRCEPAVGILGAGQQTEMKLIFTPNKAEMYEGQVNFLISDADESQKSHSVSTSSSRKEEEEDRKIISCPCVGEGFHAVVEVEPVAIEHEGPALQKKTFEWTIYNSSVCEVFYEVRWLSISDNVRSHQDEESPVQLSNNKTGVLAARSHTVVLVTLQPHSGVSKYILYILVGGSGVKLNTIPHPTSLHEIRQHPHCEVRLKGTRPAVQITDVRSLQQHRSQLWCQLAINSVNAVLAAPVQAIDLESDSFAFKQYVKGLEPIFMDVGVGTILDSKKEIILRVENAGMCAASFKFWYPTEHEGGNETWFIEDEELEDIQRILSDQLLEITPREGTIPVGSHKVITITYRHSTVGAHILPVLLRLSEGKKALLVLEGRTVLPDANALAFHHPYIYNLHPVALGDVEPPLQTITLRNTASREVEYVVHEDLLRMVAEKNCGFPVFQCLNPTGKILAGESVQLKFYFRPLEAREYHIDVALWTVDGEEYDVQFHGIGYHPKKNSAESIRHMINNAFLSIPISPTLRLPLDKCPVALSMDVIRVGAAPCFSLHRRICYLENRHNRHTYSFVWQTSLEPGSSTLEVSPNRGVLRPGQRIRCHFAMYCGSLNQVLETSVFCHIHNETLASGSVSTTINTAGGAQKSRIGNAAIMQDNTSDTKSTEENLLNDPLLDTKPSLSNQGFVRSTCTKLRPLGSNKNRLPVTSIPPEFQSLRVLAASTASHVLTSQQTFVEEGPVIDHALEFFVQARIMSIESYERLYGKQALQQMYFPMLCQNFVDPTSLHLIQKKGEKKRTRYTAEEAVVALEVLDGLLRAVIARPQVHAAFTEPIVEEAPYYREMILTTTKPASSYSSTSPSTAQWNKSPSEHISSSAVELTKTSTKTATSSQSPLPMLSSSPGPSVSSETYVSSASLTKRCDGAVLNIVEELLADVTVHVLDAIAGELEYSQTEVSKGVKNN
ncbi:uncharacterized protein TM35_000371680 [Trypanosoma theileri]|uniref:Abnormal spindle-like microcephaly-associated protein ASH domain-containing protein n=1 Tax=Trypanosoma theileri TaxID=67003 RepID=A0A1X0NKD1_9TRYP|nr:uncharacterized protein TM35_000371680 [Trypanosoma theileri]ORC85195.1 hypothetical protein TM35_000371680 [Trypanosoma theileri]